MSELPSVKEIARMRAEHVQDPRERICMQCTHEDSSGALMGYWPCDVAAVLRVLDFLFADQIAELEARVAEINSHMMTVDEFREIQ